MLFRSAVRLLWLVVQSLADELLSSSTRRQWRTNSSSSSDETGSPRFRTLWFRYVVSLRRSASSRLTTLVTQMNVPQAVLKGVMQPYFAYAQAFRGTSFAFLPLALGTDSVTQWRDRTFRGGGARDREFLAVMRNSRTIRLYSLS